MQIVDTKIEKSIPEAVLKFYLYVKGIINYKIYLSEGRYYSLYMSDEDAIVFVTSDTERDFKEKLKSSGLIEKIQNNDAKYLAEMFKNKATW